MKSDVISLSTAGEGFRAAEEETQKVVEYERLDARQALHLQLITQEMLTLVNSVTHQTQVSFWIENEGPDYEIHVATKAALNKEERAQLISAASSRKNEAAGTFLGYLRDCFEEAVAAEPDHSDGIPQDVWDDLSNRVIMPPDWDGFERSVLKTVADKVKVSIRGGLVDITVCKHFA